MSVVTVFGDEEVHLNYRFGLEAVPCGSTANSQNRPKAEVQTVDIIAAKQSFT